MTLEDAELLTDEQILKVRREIMVTFHPDRWSDPDKKLRAQALFVRAQSPKRPVVSHALVMRSPTTSYELSPDPIQGDVSDVYVTTDKRFVVKVSGFSEGNRLLKKEAENLGKMSKQKFAPHYVPVLYESFSGKDGRIVNVFNNDPDLVPFSRMVDVDGVHACWLFNRILESIMMMEDVGIRHTAIVPDHVMVNPKTHRIKLVGWGHSTTGKIDSIPSRYRSWYPDWLKKLDSGTNGIDLVFAAKTVLTMNRIDGRIRKFLGGCHYGDETLEIQNEFKKLLLSVYGPPKFVPLVI